jgi:hypothetical protein
MIKYRCCLTEKRVLREIHEKSSMTKVSIFTTAALEGGEEREYALALDSPTLEGQAPKTSLKQGSTEMNYPQTLCVLS